MSDQISNTTDKSIQNGNCFSARYELAVSVHTRIKLNEETAAAALVEFCRDLKRMRDEKLYSELGYENFDDYTEQAAGIGKSQAYSYIQAFERLGGTLLQNNANLGISKIKLLAMIPAPERDEFLATNDVEAVSTRELAEMVEALKAKNEQLSLFESEKDENLRRISELEAELKELGAAPVPVAVQEPDPKEIQRLVELHMDESWQAREQEHKKELEEAEERAREAADKARKEAERKLKEARKQLQEEAEKAAEASYAAESAALEQAERQRKEALERAERLEKQLKIAGNETTTKFSVVFDSFRDDYKKLLELLEQAGETDAETAGKLRAALKKTLEVMLEKTA